jgi:hypothetical protein
LKRLIVCVLAIICVVCVSPAVQGADIPVPGSLVVSIWPEYSDTQVFLLEQEELPASATLPAEVRFALPKGASLAWAGEISGTGDTSKDQQAIAKVNHLPDYEEVVFQLTKSRVAQVEANWAGLVSNGNKRSVTINWVQRYPAVRTLFGFQEPSQATNIKMSPAVAFVRQSTQGFKIHQTGPHSLAVGEALKVQITYDRGITTPSVGATGAPVQAATATAAGGPTSPISAPLVILILVLGAIGIGAIVYFDSRRQ